MMYWSMLVVFFMLTAAASGEDYFLKIYYEVDKLLFDSNYKMVFDHPNGISMDASDFQTELPFSFMGLSLPFATISFIGSKGSILSNNGFHLEKFGCGFSDQLDTCTLDSLDITLASKPLPYGISSFILSYENVKAKFLFWEIEGKFSYSYEPTIRFWEVQNSTICGFFNFGEMQNGPNIWISHSNLQFTGAQSPIAAHFWDVLKAHSLTRFNDIAVDIVREPLTSILNDRFIKPWCKAYNKDCS
uniref:Uncharacterized protein n=1 Tax=Lygus hesperus TaxID=30085 RepID=A0A0A9Z7J4_LYGHE